MDLVSAALAHGPPQIQQVKQHEATFSMVQKGAECPKPSSKRITCVHELVGIGSKESCQVRHVTVSHVSLWLTYLLIGIHWRPSKLPSAKICHLPSTFQISTSAPTQILTRLAQLPSPSKAFCGSVEPENHWAGWHSNGGGSGASPLSCGLVMTSSGSLHLRYSLVTFVSIYIYIHHGFMI